MPGRAQYYCCGKQHTNIPHGRSALLLLRKPLSFKTALRLFVPTGLPRKINPSEFASLVHKPPPPEVVARIVSEETLDSLVRAELQRRRERLKGRRGAWSPVKTRNPLERLLEKEMIGTNFRKNLRRNAPPPQGVLENTRAAPRAHMPARSMTGSWW